MLNTLLLDTDIGMDCDDAGAMAILHLQAARCNTAIGAVVCSAPLPDSPALIELINRYYGADVPVGQLVNPLKGQGYCDMYAQPVLQALKPDYRRKNYPEAVSVLRQALVQCADNSVLYVTIGPQTNMARLLLSKPDAISSLSGRELLERKLKKTLVMAGRFVDHSTEFNVVVDIHSAQIIAEQWPGEIIYVPHELGTDVISGYGFTAMQRQTNPVAMAYTVYGGETGRYSWDPITVIQALEPENVWFRPGEKGKVTVAKDGVTSFCSTSGGRHRILGLSSDPVEAGRALTKLLCAEKGEGKI